MDPTSETQPHLPFSHEVPSLEQGEGGVPVFNTARLCPQCVSGHGWRQTSSQMIPSVSEASLHLAVKIPALCFAHALTCSRPCTWALSPDLKWTLGGVPRAGPEASEVTPGCGIWSHPFENSHCISYFSLLWKCLTQATEGRKGLCVPTVWKHSSWWRQHGGKSLRLLVTFFPGQEAGAN